MQMHSLLVFWAVRFEWISMAEMMKLRLSFILAIGFVAVFSVNCASRKIIRKSDNQKQFHDQLNFRNYFEKCKCIDCRPTLPATGHQYSSELWKLSKASKFCYEYFQRLRTYSNKFSSIYYLIAGTDWRRRWWCENYSMISWSCIALNEFSFQKPQLQSWATRG